MKLTRLTLDGSPRRYLLFQQRRGAPAYQLVKDARASRLEAMASSEFYFDARSGALAKLKGDKHARSARFLRWLLRDYIEKRLFFQFDARKEVCSLRKLQAAGLATPQCLAWGLSLDVRNRLGSLLIMEHVANAVTGAEYFHSLAEEQRLGFISRLCDELIRLARAGYVHRDLHLQNFLCRPDGEIVWIDTHIRSLPRSKSARWQVIEHSISHLLEAPYQGYLHQEMQRRWQATPVSDAPREEQGATIKPTG